MADKRPGQKIKMTSIDELLCVPDSSGPTEISVRDIYPFENHPFKVLDDEKMEELIESTPCKIEPIRKRGRGIQDASEAKG